MRIRLCHTTGQSATKPTRQRLGLTLHHKTLVDKPVDDRHDLPGPERSSDGRTAHNLATVAAPPSPGFRGPANVRAAQVVLVHRAVSVESN